MTKNKLLDANSNLLRFEVLFQNGGLKKKSKQRSDGTDLQTAKWSLTHGNSWEIVV